MRDTIEVHHVYSQSGEFLETKFVDTPNEPDGKPVDFDIEPLGDKDLMHLTVIRAD